MRGLQGSSLGTSRGDSLGVYRGLQRDNGSRFRV